jgi:hypothetical protein
MKLRPLNQADSLLLRLFSSAVVHNKRITGAAALKFRPSLKLIAIASAVATIVFLGTNSRKPHITKAKTTCSFFQYPILYDQALNLPS